MFDIWGNPKLDYYATIIQKIYRGLISRNPPEPQEDEIVENEIHSETSEEEDEPDWKGNPKYYQKGKNKGELKPGKKK